MAQKCVHKGCEKTFTDPEEACTYHPGPPVFHEGQKGWKCCKPRVLTFEEFMTIAPCTTGKHSTTDLPPAIEKSQQSTDTPSAAASLASKIDELAASARPERVPVIPTANTETASQVPVESEDDDLTLEIPDGKTCRRRGCDAAYKAGGSREDERCIHHPGAPIFHEGSKGYSCCKRRVLEFDQFMRIEGCATKERHLFIGSGKKEENGGSGEAVDTEVLQTVRHDFYQTSSTVIVSFFLKKIVKDKSTVDFRAQEVVLDLVTSDTPPKRYTAEIPLFGQIDPDKSAHKILGTKLEVTLAKADGTPWPVLRGDETTTGEIYQVGKASLLK